MGDVDIVDTLGNQYYFDHWLRNFKWWQPIFLWGMQLLPVNTYVCYMYYMDI